MPLLLAVSLWAYQSQTQTITLSFPPTPAVKAVRLLAEASGRHLKASAVLADDVVVARLKNASVDLALSHLSESLCARWEKRDDGNMWLVPDPAAVARRDAIEAAENERHLMNSLKYLQKRLAEQPAELDAAAIQKYLQHKADSEKKRKMAEAANDYAHMFVHSSADEESPAWRALVRLILMLDPRQLLALPNDAREVWAESPTPMQHGLPEGSVDVLLGYRREFALLEPNAVAARVKLVATKWEQGQAFNMSLEVLDGAGKKVDGAFARMNDDSESMKIPFPMRSKGAVKEGEVPIAVPAAVKEFRLALSTDYEGRDRLALLDKYRSHLLMPTRFEPTEPFRGEDLVLAAEATDQNLIGTVSDFVNARSERSESLTPSAVFQKSDVARLPSEDGWVVVRGGEQIARSSRKGAEALIANSYRVGGITVDAAAEWVSHIPGRWPFIGWVGDYLQVLFSGQGPYSSISTTIDDISLRFWGTIPSGAMESLRKGDTVRLSQLPQASRSEIEKIVYWFRGLDGDNLDPTEVLPNGISDGSVSLTIKETPVFYGWSAAVGPPASVMPLDAKMFGNSLAVGNSYWEITPDVYRSFNRFRMGINRSYDLHFSIEPGALPMTMSLSETLFPPEGQVLEQLPDDVRGLVEQARLAALAAPKKADAKSVIPPQTPR